MDNHRLRNRDPETLRSKDLDHRDPSPARDSKFRATMSPSVVIGSRAHRKNLLSLLACLAAAAGLIYLGGRLIASPTELNVSEAGTSSSARPRSDAEQWPLPGAKNNAVDVDRLQLEDGIIRSTLPPFTARKGPLPESRFLAHAPGFSVIQNAYYDSRRNKWYFIAPDGMPWAFPELKYVVTPGKGKWDDWADPLNDRNVKDQTLEAAEVYMGSEEACRLLDLPPLTGNKRWPDVIEVIPGNTLFFNDNIYLDHYYHVVGEMFMGMWRAWTHYLSVAHRAFKGQPPTDVIDSHIDRLIFAHVDFDIVSDHAGMNMFTLGTWFADAEFEFAEEWRQRSMMAKIYLFEKVVISDRISGHRGPRCKGKTFDEVFQLSAPKDWVTGLRDRILEKFPSKFKPANLPVITYMSRQKATTRNLRGDVNEQLIAELQKIADEGLAEFNVEEFTDKDAKEDQVAKLARTTILVGLHGNGLTHSIWMDPTPQSAIIEIQTKEMNMDDYSALSSALGLTHWIAQVDRLCTRETCGPRGHSEDVNLAATDFVVDAKMVADKVRETIARK